MKQVEIRHIDGRTILFTGKFRTVKEALETAAAKGIALGGADLRRANLVNAQLDDISLRGACLAGANLMGANLSEGDFTAADFTGAGLQNACFAASILDGCDFDGAQFGATDIAGASLRGCRFTTLSAFSLGFRDAAVLEDCRFDDLSGPVCPFSRPPVVIHGLDYPVIIMDRHMKIGASIGILGQGRLKKA